MGVTNSLKTTSLLTQCLLVLMISGCSNRSVNPSPNLSLLELTGTWTTQYSPDETDTITIDADGNFSQLYRNIEKEYVFNSGKDQASLEKLTTGIIRLHLPGGRYYLEGIKLAETNGRIEQNEPLGLIDRPFYDPFADATVKMVDELVLIVLVNPKGDLILHHLWRSSDRGFLVFNADSEIFYRE